MKIIFLLVMLNVLADVSGQNIGIGTTTPNSKALLDISSTTKGVLLPRMTTSGRLSISTPPNGLLVYDTDRNEFCHYVGTGWRSILNSEYWTRGTSQTRIYTASDSVGIGLSSPTEWLDVDGNIRSRNSILADDNVNAAGTVYGGALSTGGNLVVVGTSLLNGNITGNANLTVNGTSTLDGNVNANANLTVDGTALVDGALTTNTGITIDNAGATLQLQNNNVNTGFFQIAGINTRLGTNSGNTNGSIIFRLNGNDRVQIDPSGDINIEGKITKTSATGFSNLLPLCYGKVSDGNIASGTSNFTVQRHSAGNYTIFCSGVTPNSVVLTTVHSAQGWAVPEFITNGSFKVITTNPGLVVLDYTFSFIVYNP
jgi:hypothetical protein